MLAYSDEEQLLIGAALLDQVEARLEESTLPPTPADLNRLSRVLMNVVMARELILARQDREPPMSDESLAKLAAIRRRNEGVRRELARERGRAFQENV